MKNMRTFIYGFTFVLLAVCVAVTQSSGSQWNDASTCEGESCCVDLGKIFSEIDVKACAKWDADKTEPTLYWDDKVVYNPEEENDEICTYLSFMASFCIKIKELTVDVDKKEVHGCGEGYMKFIGGKLPTLHECITFGDNMLDIPSDIEYMILALKKFI